MKPIFSVGGMDPSMNDRVLSINVTEHVADETDKLQIEFDNRDSLIQFPPRGIKIAVSLGWEDTGLVPLGTFTIDTVAMGWGPRTMIVSGSSANLSANSTLKQSRTNNYENKSLDDIAGEIAGRNSLSATVDPTIQMSPYTMLHQTDESDMSFIGRICRDNGARFKIAGDKLIIQRIGNTTNSVGGSMGIIVTPDMVKPSTVRVTWRDRATYAGAESTSYDPANAQRTTAGTPNGFSIRHPQVDATRAQAAADGKKAELQTNEADAQCELAVGNPSATASGNLTFQGFCVGIDGNYPISTVEHNYDSAGYTTKIEANNSTSD